MIYVGELSYRKHQDVLIKAIDKIVNQIPNLKLLLVGDGDLFDTYQELIIKNNLSKNVELLGYRKDVPKLMLLSDIVVSSSRQEGLPVNVMEAMATSLPLIVSDCRGNKDLVKHMGNGLLVTKDDEGEYAKSILKLYNDRKLKERLSASSLQMISDFSLEKIIDDMSIIYKSVFNAINND